MKAVTDNGLHEVIVSDAAPDAYEHFDRRDDGWTKVVPEPGQADGAG